MKRLFGITEFNAKKPTKAYLIQDIPPVGFDTRW
jgi:hypothetical protein